MSDRLLFLAWTSRDGRARDIAAALGGDPVLIYPTVPRWLRHPFSTALRYVISLFATVGVLVRTRPVAVIVTNPPLFPPLVLAVWSRITGGTYVMDSHPSAFGAKGKTVVARLQAVHRWLARGAGGVMVTTEERARQIDAWGGKGIVVHEAPSHFAEPARDAHAPVLFVGVFAPDEPVEVVIEAARAMPDVRFQITGDPMRAPQGLVAGAPPNVEFVGYLAADRYRDALSAASLVLTLTTEPSSVMRSAYEAVYTRVPVVMTGTAVLRSTFPFAVFCDNTGPGIAAAIREALSSYSSLVEDTEKAAAVQHERWADQLSQLRGALGR